MRVNVQNTCLNDIIRALKTRKHKSGGLAAGNKKMCIRDRNYARLSREGYLLICEGYLDVISLHQAVFTNAVASLGTAFTSQHANVLKRYTDQVILTYDSDGAGVKAVSYTHLVPDTGQP